MRANFLLYPYVWFLLLYFKVSHDCSVALFGDPCTFFTKLSKKIVKHVETRSPTREL